MAEGFAQQVAKGKTVGQNIKPVYLSIFNPIDLRQDFSFAQLNTMKELGLNSRYYGNVEHMWEVFDYENGGQELVKVLKKMGYDGAIMYEEDSKGIGSTTWVAFDPSQIKSATGNVGTFDKDNPSILAKTKNWLHKIAVQVSLDNILDHVYAAIKYTLPGKWSIWAKRDGPIMQTYKLQRYNVISLLGKDLYTPNDQYIVKVFLYVKRNTLPFEAWSDLNMTPQQAWKKMQDETTPLNTFDSATGNALVYFHVVVWGRSPDRSWENKYPSSQSFDNMYEIGNTRPPAEGADWLEFNTGAETPLKTPTEVAEWVQTTIEKAHRDFDDGEGNEGDQEPELPPDTPYGVKSPSKVPSLV